MYTIVAAFGTRAEAVKFAPLIRQLRQREGRLVTKVVVTAEHRQPLDQVLRLFEIEPDLDLDLAGQSPDLATLFSRASVGLSEAFASLEPDLVLVLGDTVTTLAATVVAYYRRIPVAHVEAGLRADDKFTTFPEEGHRLMVSSIADLHFAPTTRAHNNLLAEGVSPGKIFVTGNPGIDALKWVRDHLEAMRQSGQIRLRELFENGDDPLPVSLLKAIRRVEGGASRLILITGSRPENFGSSLQSICGALARLSDEYPDDVFVYPVDLAPQVHARIHHLLHEHENIYLLPPLDYLPFVYLMQISSFVLTDSGSIQEEAPGLGKPVLVMRRLTDRPEALEAGTVRLVGTDAVTIVTAARRLLNDDVHHKRMSEAPNPFGDGHAAETIAAILERYATGTLYSADAAQLDAS